MQHCSTFDKVDRVCDGKWWWWWWQQRTTHFYIYTIICVEFHSHLIKCIVFCWVVCWRFVSNKPTTNGFSCALFIFQLTLCVCVLSQSCTKSIFNLNVFFPAGIVNWCYCVFSFFWVVFFCLFLCFFLVFGPKCETMLCNLF